MIQYHGGPISDPDAAVRVWKGRHALVSWPRPQQLAPCRRSLPATASTMAPSHSGIQAPSRLAGLHRLVQAVRTQCDFAILPDAIGEAPLPTTRCSNNSATSIPLSSSVWHMDEPIERLQT